MWSAYPQWCEQLGSAGEALTTACAAACRQPALPCTLPHRCVRCSACTNVQICCFPYLTRRLPTPSCRSGCSLRSSATACRTPMPARCAGAAACVAVCNRRGCSAAVAALARQVSALWHYLQPPHTCTAATAHRLSAPVACLCYAGCGAAEPAGQAAVRMCGASAAAPASLAGRGAPRAAVLLHTGARGCLAVLQAGAVCLGLLHSAGRWSKEDTSAPGAWGSTPAALTRRAIATHSPWSSNRGTSLLPTCTSSCATWANKAWSSQPAARVHLWVLERQQLRRIGRGWLPSLPITSTVFYALP